MIEDLPTARGLKDLFNRDGYLLPNQTVLLIPRFNESDESECTSGTGGQDLWGVGTSGVFFWSPDPAVILYSSIQELLAACTTIGLSPQG